MESQKVEDWKGLLPTGRGWSRQVQSSYGLNMAYSEPRDLTTDRQSHEGEKLELRTGFWVHVQGGTFKRGGNHTLEKARVISTPGTCFMDPQVSACPPWLLSSIFSNHLSLLCIVTP